jgi:hypothetical protein
MGAILADERASPQAADPGIFAFPGEAGVFSGAMRISIVIALVLSLAAALSCRKDEAATTDPESASDDNLLGIDVGSQSGGKPRGKPVPVGCIQDPADPECAEVLGVEATGDGSVEFTGDACRVNLCHDHGDCDLDPEGFVACTCDDDATGPTCDKRKK